MVIQRNRSSAGPALRSAKFRIPLLFNGPPVGTPSRLSMTYRIVVGSFTDDVYTLDFDPSSKSLNVVAKTTLGTKPSWIAQHPNDPTLVFAALEQTDGKIIAVKFDKEDGKGRVVGEVSCGGADPCSVLATEDELIAANVS